MTLLLIRCAIAASYLTLAIADNDRAGDLAVPYGALILLVFVIDVLKERRRAPA